MLLIVLASGSSTEAVPTLLLTLAFVLVGAKLAGELLEPAGQPAVLGMLPRGEVGLIFAGIGAQLWLDGRPVIDPGTYAAAVFMVVTTTLVTPPLLLWSLKRERRPASS